MDFRWLLVRILPSIGLLLALALLSHILRERRPPTSTLAWLMAIIFIPYLGVPLYLIFRGRANLRNAILAQIFRAKQRIWVITPYFVPDELLSEALCIAACRHVDVSIIIPKKSNHRLADLAREGYLSRLQDVDAKIWLYEPCMLHARAILVDDTLAMVGSANMDMRSLLLNYEIALCIYDSDAIRQLESWMMDLKLDCSAHPRKPKRAFGLIESVGRLFAPLL